MSSKPAVFVSYSKADDDHDQGRLNAFVRRLEDEIHAQTSSNAAVFFDRQDLAIGADWRSKISEKLDEAGVFIPVITPNYFKSRYCRQELKHFLDREKASGRHGSIIPVFYIGDDKRLMQDELAREIAQLHHRDWRHLRFEPFTSGNVDKEMSKTAQEVQGALSRA